MRFVRLLAAMAALAFSGQAQAAKIFEISGNSTGSTSTPLPFSFPTGWGSHTIGVQVKFHEPFSGWVGISGDYSFFYLQDGLPSFNSFDYFGNQIMANGNKATITTRLSSGLLNGTHYTYRANPMNLDVLSDDESAPVSYTITGFYAVPEPATWAMMVLGFGGIGAAIRVRPRRARYNSLA